MIPRHGLEAHHFPGDPYWWGFLAGPPNMPVHGRRRDRLCHCDLFAHGLCFNCEPIVD